MTRAWRGSGACALAGTMLYAAALAQPAHGGQAVGSTSSAHAPQATSAPAAHPPMRPARAEAALPASGTVQVAFSPWDDAEQLVVDAIEGARTDIRVHAYVMTSRRIANALVAAHRRGVRVEVLADRAMVFAPGADGEDAARSRPNTRIPTLRKAGIPVWLETRYAAAHNKVMIIDARGTNPVVLTGSYNWTHSAQARNAENLLVFRAHRALTDRYAENWDRHRRDALPYQP